MALDRGVTALARRLAFLGAALASAAGASATDRWDAAAFPDCGDGEKETCNELWPGVPQTHDLQNPDPPGGLDEDWMVVETKAGHSYEVRVSGSNLALETPACAACVEVDRVDAGGTVLTAAVAPHGPGPASGGTSANSLVVRWIGNADERHWIRVRGTSNLGAADEYDIVLAETTYFAPRWNQVGSQTSVFILRNATAAPVSGTLLLYDAAGAQVHAEPTTIPRNGLVVFSTGSVPALAGRSGSAAFVHTGGSGALVGKVVALEVATGFTFDTVLSQAVR